MAGHNGDGNGRWRELGIKLKQRRALLDPRWRNRRAFAEENHLDYRLIYDIEEARRPNFGVTTLTAIEVAYRLGPGSIAAFRKGGEFAPTPAATAADERDARPAAAQAALDREQIPAEHYASVDADYAWRTQAERIAIAEERGLVHEAAIWAYPDDRFTDTQRRLLIVYARWKTADGAVGQRGTQAG
jgi:hypothetical protein